MKTALITIALLTSCVLPGCNTQPLTLDDDTFVLYDMTDATSGLPSANDLLSAFDLKNNPYQSIRLNISTISEKDHNRTTCISLEHEEELQSNPVIREAKILHFGRQLQQCLNAIRNTDTSSHSIIYRAIAACANELASSTAKRRLLVIYSNLYENSDINFYHQRVLRQIQDSPDAVQHCLEREYSIQSLKGIEVWLIYNPASYQDNDHFRLIAGLYQRMLQSHGATVHVATQFQPQ